MRQQYSSYQDCVNFFESAEAKKSNLFKVEYIGKTWEERDILCVTISKDVERADEKPALFYTGTIHAREWIGIELSLAFAKYILDHIDYDPQLNELLSRATLYMVPCANPDGFEYSRTHFSFWRKNRRQNADGSFGVDLNRNFSVGFTPNKNTSSNVYSGPSAFSEPETAAIRDFVEAHENISIALDYHSQGNVFFPAHNFIHEDAIDATDLNVLASNMAEEIRKVSSREYGVHMGKPPTHLISGSGREFYYSKGALSLVVEVGTRNISDYIEHMSENINENLPALMSALNEVPNYAKVSQLPRVESFIATSVGAKEVTLEWEYSKEENVYFEIYRSKSSKSFCQSANRVGMTKSYTYTDLHVKPSTNYYYFIRAVCKERRVKSPYAPKIGIRTEGDSNMFSKVLFPNADAIGYVGEKTQKNRDHFGNNSLFVGMSEGKGVCYGVAEFSLERVPENAIITGAKISYYPMNRVSVQIERYGQWRVGMIDERTVDSLYSFDDIKTAKVLGYIDRPTKSHQLSQGLWRTYTFATQEVSVLQECLKRNKALFRMDGPKSLPLDRSSQMMQWDIGYGKFSSGLTYRPKLDITYTLNDVKLELASQNEFTISRAGVDENKLLSGFDRNGDAIYSFLEFDLSAMPDMENTVIFDTYVELNTNNITSPVNLRFHLEMVKCVGSENSFENIKNREVVERIGYDVSVEDLKAQKQQRFIFDTYAIQELINAASDEHKLYFVIYATSQKSFAKSCTASFVDKKLMDKPRLVINYIKKRRNGVEAVGNLRQSIENNMIRLDWNSPKDEALAGVIVVKNRFHVPCSPYDGQKLYAGTANYTYDNFGSVDIEKYYAVFTYDDVPNYSEATSLKYEGRQ
ncbi:MAG: M14 family zinc carboxypeptidase [Campylobacterota bacterium]|nr:M14 family zinc carboxypeptidase [Campylobacterota bacterium]